METVKRPSRRPWRRTLSPSLRSSTTIAVVVLATASCSDLRSHPNAAPTELSQTAVGADLVEDFSYASTAEMLSDPRDLYSEAEDIQPHRVVLDESEGVDGSAGSMRYDYEDMTGRPGRCGGYTIGRNLSLESAQREIWLELWARFSSDWANAPPWMDADCGPYNPDFKMVFGRMTRSSRFDFRFGNSVNDVIIAGYPGDTEAFPVAIGATGPAASDYWDGEWHRYRFHWRFDPFGQGEVEVWIDDSKIVDRSGLSMSGDSSNRIYGIALGRNLDPSAGHSQELWWDGIKVWYEGNDPGW